LQSLKKDNLGANRARICPYLSHNMSSSFDCGPFNIQQRSHSPIDLTSSPPQPTVPVRMFGKDVTNSSLLRQLDDVCSKTQVRKFATTTEPTPPVEPKVRQLPPNTTSKVRYKFRREWERTKLEKDLVAYSFKRPAGKVWTMRKKPEEIESERAELHWNVFKGKSTNARIAVSPVHIPTLHFCTTVKESNECLPKIKAGEMLSFDMEWEFDSITGISKKTSVVQLASATDIYILHLAMMPSIPEELLRILNDSTILKCGVAIKQDAAKFRRDFDNVIEGCLDLSFAARQAEPERWKSHNGLIALRDLSRIYLKRKLDKSIDVRAGKWNNASLDERQCEYAANDVYVGVELIHTFASMIGNLDPLKGGEDIFQTNQFRKFLIGINVVSAQEKERVLDEQGETSKNAINTKSIPVKPSWDDDESDFESIASESENLFKEKSKSSQTTTSKPTPATSSSNSRPKSRPAVKSTLLKEKTGQMTKNAVGEQSSSTKRKLPSEQSSPKKDLIRSKPTPSKKGEESMPKTAIEYWQEGQSFAEIASRLRAPPYAISTVGGHVLKSLNAKSVSLKKAEKDRLRKELKPDQMKYVRNMYHSYLVKQDILLFGTVESKKPQLKKTKEGRRSSVSSSSGSSSILSS
jgi:3'-5' exonuclease